MPAKDPESPPSIKLFVTPLAVLHSTPGKLLVPPAAEAVAIATPPLQSTESIDTNTIIGFGCNILTESFTVQPTLSVIVTIYFPEGRLIVASVAGPASLSTIVPTEFAQANE